MLSFPQRRADVCVEWNDVRTPVKCPKILHVFDQRRHQAPEVACTLDERVLAFAVGTLGPAIDVFSVVDPVPISLSPRVHLVQLILWDDVPQHVLFFLRGPVSKVPIFRRAAYFPVVRIVAVPVPVQRKSEDLNTIQCTRRALQPAEKVLEVSDVANVNRSP